MNCIRVVIHGCNIVQLTLIIFTTCYLDYSELEKPKLDTFIMPRLSVKLAKRVCHHRPVGKYYNKVCWVFIVRDPQLDTMPAIRWEIDDTIVYTIQNTEKNEHRIVNKSGIGLSESMSNAVQWTMACTIIQRAHAEQLGDTLNDLSCEYATKISESDSTTENEPT